MAFNYRKLGEPYSELERLARHETAYGETALPPRGTGLIRAGESLETRRLGAPRTEEQRMLTHYERYGTMEEMPSRGTGLTTGSTSTGVLIVGGLLGAVAGGVVGILIATLISSQGAGRHR